MTFGARRQVNGYYAGLGQSAGGRVAIDTLERSCPVTLIGIVSSFVGFLPYDNRT